MNNIFDEKSDDIIQENDYSVKKNNTRKLNRNNVNVKTYQEKCFLILL